MPDDYSTPKHVFEDVEHLIPKTRCWEEGKSGQFLRELGYDVIHENKDFFTYEPDDYDFIYSNPPFSKLKKVMTRMKELGKPFVLILPAPVMNNQYFGKLFPDDDIQVIVPPKRINFIKPKDDGKRNHASLDCNYYCWKMNLPTRSATAAFLPSCKGNANQSNKYSYWSLLLPQRLSARSSMWLIFVGSHLSMNLC